MKLRLWSNSIRPLASGARSFYESCCGLVLEGMIFENVEFGAVAAGTKRTLSGCEEASVWMDDGALLMDTTSNGAKSSDKKPQRSNKPLPQMVDPFRVRGTLGLGG